MDQKVVVTLSIYTVEAPNKNQGLLMDIRKKDMVNNIIINMTFMMLELLNCLPTMFETDFQLISCEFQLIGCDFQLISSDFNLIDGVFQLISLCFPTHQSVFSNSSLHTWLG